MKIVSNAGRPDLQVPAQASLRDGWPAFVLRGEVPRVHRDAVAEYFPRYDVLLLEDDLVLARATAVALRWDGDTATLPDGGYDGALIAAVTEHESGVVPDTLCVVAATVRTGRTGSGLAGEVLTGLRERAAADGLARVIVPVRPTLKATYPLTSMEDFQRWTRADGLHLDPWIRTHQRLGATILRPAPRSMVDRDRCGVGAVDGHGVPAERPVRRRGRAGPGRDRPGARPGGLRGDEPLDAPPGARYFRLSDSQRRASR